MSHVTTRDNTRLNVKDWGTGRPVILLHGWPLSADSWDDQAMAIADLGMRAIAYDRRGFGRSSQPWNGYDYDTFADDLAAVIEATGAQNATLVGFSMGGGEVARYMSRHDGRNVAQAVLVSAVVPYMLKTPDNADGVDGSVFDQMITNLKEDRAHFFTGFFKNFFGQGVISKAVSEEVLEWARDVAMMASLKATIGCVEAFGRTDFRSDLNQFNVPTLIIHGTADKTVPIDSSGRASARMIRQSHLIEYDGAPHGLFVTHKEQLTGDLLAFLTREMSSATTPTAGTYTGYQTRR
jgi:non-heme chloroperoxidase